MYIAILEDDAIQQSLLQQLVHEGGHRCRISGTVAAFRRAVLAERFDLALVDWMLPDGRGDAALRWLRQQLGWELPAIVVTARADEATVVAALQAGADDVVVKPAKPLELLARMMAVARRARPGAPQVLRAGDYEVDLERQRLAVAGQAVPATQREFDLAVCLFQHRDKLLSREFLLRKVWGATPQVDARTVDSHLSRLRRKLGLDGRHGWKLSAVYGFGYRFEPVENRPA